MQLKLREKILIPVVTTIALGMLAGFVYSYITTTRAIKKGVSRALVREVSLTARLMDHWLQARHTDLLTWSTQPVLIEALTETGYYGKSAEKGANALLSNLENGYPYYDFLYLLDLDGHLISTSHQTDPKQFVAADREYFKISKKGNAWVSKIIISRESGKKVFVVSSPVKSGEKIVGILAGAVNVSAFSSLFIHKFKLGQQGFAYIVENTGQIMAISIGKKNCSNIAAFDFGKAILSSNKGTHTYRHNNRNLFSAYQKLASKEWTFVVSQSLDEAFASARKTRWHTMVLDIALLFLVSLVVGGIFREMIYHRFNRMLEAISMVKKGNLEVRIKNGDGNDEIGELSKAFNTMAARLEKTLFDLKYEIQMRKKTEQDLENHRDNLEILVTERTAELLDLQNYLSDIINSMPSIIVGVDNKTRVSKWNLKAAQTTGITPVEALGKPFETLFPYLGSHVGKIKYAILHHKTQQISKMTKEVDNRRYYEELTIYPLMSKGMEGAVIRIDDITRRVHLEELMIQSEKMMSVGGLAAGMAHEINNPLAGIIQNVQVLKNRMSMDLPVNRKVAEKLGLELTLMNRYMEERNMYRLIENIMNAGGRAATIVSNMLSFSRKETNASKLINLPELMDKTIDLAKNDYDLKKSFDFKKIKVIKDYEAERLHIRCHPSMLQQVFLNILKNGAQAMASVDEPGKINVSSFVISIKNEKNFARVEISDNGPGIDKETQKRLFEPFFTTKEIGGGTGLGMSISYFIIAENHGGTIEVVSEPGQGCTFIICLPLDGKDDRMQK